MRSARRTPKLRFFILTLIIGCVSVIAVINAKPTSAGVPGSVIISELMYNPGTGNQFDEFLELYNTTGADINLNGWCFTAGVTACFSNSDIVPAHGYFIASPSASQTLSTYGITIGTAYTGNLSNGGETLTLKDESLNTITSLTYSDSSPWPASADGGGPSLELRDTGSDSSQAVNWGASLAAGGTPKAVNSIAGAGAPPVITSVSDPNDVSSSDAVTVTASVADVDTVELIYRLGFAAEATLVMHDDGTHGDGAAADGTYGATIPAQAAGELVRFKISAENEDGNTTSPSTDDSIDYYGYAVQDPSVTSNAPILQWFIAESDYDQLQIVQDYDNPRFSCVIVYGNEVYDNSEIRMKGNNTRYMPKKGYKLYLPSGYELQVAGAERAEDEFHLNADYSAEDIAKVPTLWWVAEEAGLPVPDVIPIRIQRNGQFEGTYNLIDKYEKNWREDKGFDNGTLYEDAGEIVSGDHDMDVFFGMADQLNLDRESQELRDNTLDIVDVPNFISGVSFASLAMHLDQTINHNIMQYIDDDTGRWSTLWWDFDLAMGNGNGTKTMVSPNDIFESGGGTYWGQYGIRFYSTVPYSQPDFREMYFRRLRTLTDKLYSTDAFAAKYNELSAMYQDDVELDNQKWVDDGRRGSKAEHMAAIARQKQVLLNYLRQSWAIPESQTDAERQSVYFEEVVPNGDSANEYIKISNTSDAAVDLSDWYIEGIDYTLPKSSVVPSNGSIYLLKNDAGYKSSHPSVLVMGQYPNSLGSFGNLKLLTETGEEIDSYDY